MKKSVFNQVIPALGAGFDRTVGTCRAISQILMSLLFQTIKNC